MARKRYMFVWGNTPERAARQLTTCKVVGRPPNPTDRHTVRVKFEADNQEMEISRLALRTYHKFVTRQLTIF